MWKPARMLESLVSGVFCCCSLFVFVNLTFFGKFDFNVLNFTQLLNYILSIELKYLPAGKTPVMWPPGWDKSLYLKKRCNLLIQKQFWTWKGSVCFWGDLKSPLYGHTPASRSVLSSRIQYNWQFSSSHGLISLKRWNLFYFLKI